MDCRKWCDAAKHAALTAACFLLGLLGFNGAMDVVGEDRKILSEVRKILSDDRKYFYVGILNLYGLSEGRHNFNLGNIKFEALRRRYQNAVI